MKTMGYLKIFLRELLPSTDFFFFYKPMFSTKSFNHVLHFLSIFNKLTQLSSELDDVIQL